MSVVWSLLGTASTRSQPAQDFSNPYNTRAFDNQLTTSSSFFYIPPLLCLLRLVLSACVCVAVRLCVVPSAPCSAGGGLGWAGLADVGATVCKSYTGFCCFRVSLERSWRRSECCPPQRGFLLRQPRLLLLLETARCVRTFTYIPNTPCGARCQPRVL